MVGQNIADTNQPGISHYAEQLLALTGRRVRIDVSAAKLDSAVAGGLGEGAELLERD